MLRAGKCGLDAGPQRRASGYAGIVAKYAQRSTAPPRRAKPLQRTLLQRRKPCARAVAVENEGVVRHMSMLCWAGMGCQSARFSLCAVRAAE